MPAEQFDVFLSFDWRKLVAARRIRDALLEAGATVWFAEEEIEDHESIMRAIKLGVANSKVLVAYYSAGYPTRRACQFELTAAFLAAQRLGDPRRRVLVINPEREVDHIERGTRGCQRL